MECRSGSVELISFGETPQMGYPRSMTAGVQRESRGRRHPPVLCDARAGGRLCSMNAGWLLLASRTSISSDVGFALQKVGPADDSQYPVA